MMFFKKKQDKEIKTEEQKKEVISAASEAEETATKEMNAKAEMTAKKDGSDRGELTAKEESEPLEETEVLEPIGTPLTRQVRLTIDQLADEEGTKVERKVRDCDRAILITESLAGAYRAGNSGDFREKYNCNCSVIGYTQADQLLNALVTAAILNIKNISGQDNKKALCANAVRAAQMILDECGVTNEYAEIAATDKLMQLLNAPDGHLNS